MNQGPPSPTAPDDGPPLGARHWRLGVFGCRLGLALWAVACLYLGAILMTGHWAALPTPSPVDPALHQAMSNWTFLKSGRWNLVHVLYGKCRCSHRTFEYLFERRPDQTASETVLLVGKHDEFQAQALAAGFHVEVITRRALKEDFALESAPLLLIVDPSKRARYVGGYTSRKQGLDYQDLRLLDRLRNGNAPASIPAYGCGVSQELQASLDPLGVKYQDSDE